jgi:protease I
MEGTSWRKERSNMSLKGKKVAILIARNFEDAEAAEPAQFLRENGASVTFVGMEKKTYEGKTHKEQIAADKTFDEVSVADFDALIIPGGGAPEGLRVEPAPVQFTREFVQSGKPVAAICHGPQLLISADVLRGKRITCTRGIRDDVKLAGAIYLDEEVVVDGNLITSRRPADIPAFDREIEKALSR